VPYVMGALAVAPTHLGVALDGEDGGGCGARKWPECGPTDRAGLLQRAVVLGGDDSGEGGVVPAAVAPTAGLVAPRPGAGCREGASRSEARRFFALRPIQAWSEVAERRLRGFACRLHRRCSRDQLRILRPPGVRLPGEFDRGRLRQYHRLWGKGGGAFPCTGTRSQGAITCGRGLSMPYVRPLFLERAVVSERRNGLTEYLQEHPINVLQSCQAVLQQGLFRFCRQHGFWRRLRLGVRKRSQG
jgi:hypothetical protein